MAFQVVITTLDWPVQQTAPLLYRPGCHPSRASFGSPAGCEPRGDRNPWGYLNFQPVSFLGAGNAMRKDDMTIEDVRALVKEVRTQGLQIQSHYKRLEKEYSDWEDRVKELEDIIYKAELDTGLKKEEIYQIPIEDGLGAFDISDIITEEPELDTTNILDNPP